MILPEKNAFSQIIDPPLSRRVEKPRQRGLTMVIDKGMGRNALADLLETAGAYVDILKFGFGTSTLYPSNLLQQKLRLARLYGITACTGGTLAEIAITQQRFEAMVDHSEAMGFSAVEVSDGTMELDRSTRGQAIAYVVSRNLMAITEVGKKLEAFPSVDDIVRQIDEDIQIGASFVILEGRESGENIGIYQDGGAVDESLLNRLVQKLSTASLAKVIWEAPKKSQQVALLARFGQNVNLGNIAPDEVISLESLRRGLRSDTFSWSLPPTHQGN